MALVHLQLSTQVRELRSQNILSTLNRFGVFSTWLQNMEACGPSFSIR